jgi:casein kinase II subunit beta
MSEDKQSFDFEEESFSDGGWVSWFCSLEGNEFFAEIPDEFLRDAFNLYGLRPKVAHYSEALQMILSTNTPDEDDLQDEKFLEVY